MLGGMSEETTAEVSASASYQMSCLYDMCFQDWLEKPKVLIYFWAQYGDAFA